MSKKTKRKLKTKGLYIESILIGSNRYAVIMQEKQSETAVYRFMHTPISNINEFIKFVDKCLLESGLDWENVDTSNPDYFGTIKRIQDGLSFDEKTKKLIVL